MLRKKDGAPLPAGKTKASIFKTPENYTALAPVALIAGLNILNTPGVHKPAEQLLLFSIAAGISSSITYPLKNNTNVLRPDGSDRKSFPSGHTSVAFVTAELLRREYSHISPWYAVAGYATATTTALLRVVNDRHHIDDVAAGAGIGIASTTTAYWIYSKLQPKKVHNDVPGFSIVPSISKKYYGLYLGMQL